MASSKVMKTLAALIGSRPEMGTDMQAIFAFKIKDPDQNWVIDLKARKIYEGTCDEADCAFTMSDSDFVAMFKKEADPTELFMEQRLKFEGDMGVAMSFNSLTEDLDPAEFEAMMKGGG